MELRSKRKRKANETNLDVGDRVEVRSLEDGFKGSWHLGTVVATEDCTYRVRYDHLLDDDGSGPLIESLDDSTFEIDGASNDIPRYYRGKIRPLPPCLELTKESLHYGLCVDVLYNDAWWEGVVFDHEDDSEVRTIFFPDLGDEMEVGIEMVRISRDWVKALNNWKPRGKWLFLELIDEYAHKWPLLVSVKQIWYDVREKTDFSDKISEWTFWQRTLWEDFVSQAIQENFFLTIEEVVHVVASENRIGLFGRCKKRKITMSGFYKDHVASGELVKVSDNVVVLPKSHVDATFKPVARLTHSNALVTVENLISSNDEFLMNKDAWSSPNDVTAENLGDQGNPTICDPEMHSCSRVSFADKIQPKKALDRENGAQEGVSVQNGYNGQWRRKSQICYKQNVSTAWLPLGTDLLPRAECCPDAISEYAFTWERKKRCRALVLKARMHLAYLGWKIIFQNNDVLRVRYISPSGKCYDSLFKVCLDLRENTSDSLPVRALSSAMVCSRFEGTTVPLNTLPENCYKNFSWSREIVEHRSIQVWGLRKQRKKRKNGPFHIASLSIESQANSHLHPCENMLPIAIVSNRNRRHSVNRKNDSLTVRKGHKSRVLIKLRDNLVGNYKTHLLRSSKRARQFVVCSPSHNNPRTILSWLIDNNKVLPRAKVHYIRRSDCRPMAEGRITRDGIKCSCCCKVFTLSGFEAHAGSTNRRPAASIFLEDGRSLLECQMQMVQDNNLRSLKPEQHFRVKGNQHSKNDYICSVCHYGGELVLCDQCPSSFHISCISLKDVPEGKWFCPTCRCSICGQSEFNGNKEQFTAEALLCCDQCEHKFHSGCLRKRGLMNLETYRKGNFFCSKKCEKIYFGLLKILGKSVPVGGGNLCWTILKFIKDDCHHSGKFSIEATVEHHSKLNLALSVMHECFEPVKERLTKRDLIEDVIFSRGSELSRLNFKGFYTVLLERKDELISVASLRVHGEKVAEVPLVGTRVQYRRLGMCRILMNEIEKKLTKLGVERILLPAVPQVLHTWTNSFGFSKMMKAERFKFLNYTFLDFQGTIMCQKFLTKALIAESGVSREFQDEFSGIGGNFDSDRHSIISELIQAEEIEGEIVEQKSLGDAECNKKSGCASMEMTPLVGSAVKVTDVEYIQYSNDSSSVLLIKNSADREVEERLANGNLKFYVRRRRAASMS